jgi:hypothetical protein
MDKIPSCKSITRLLACLCTAAAFGALALPAGAPARSAGSKAPSRSCRSTAKPSRHAHRKAKHACAKHHSTKSHTTHKTTKAGGSTSTGVETVPAACEDGTLPDRAGGSYSCEDGSAPACEEGTLVHAPATTAPLCAVKTGSGDECSREGGASSCPTIEFDCEGATGDAAKGCQPDGPEEAPEPEEEE